MKKYALCIGNNNYEYLSKLKCAAADAEAVHEKLIALGFDSELYIDLELKDLEKKLSACCEKLNDYEVVLLYYAGHGFQVNNDNLIVPIDYSDPQDEKLAKRYAFPLDDLMHWLDKYPNRTKIIILDACRTIHGFRGNGNNFVPIMAPQGSIIAFSTSAGQTAVEGRKHGVYTECLLEHIDDPRVSIETMFKRVRTDLVNGKNVQQIPWEHTSLIGDFQLNPNTLFDAAYYSIEAMADCEYIFDRQSKVKSIVDGLKSSNYYTQGDSLERIYDLDFDEVIANDLFVLGRNIYQAACGRCYACRSFIDNIGKNNRIPYGAQGHILNGMVFEIYYNHHGEYRIRLKNDYAEAVIKNIESEPYYSSCEYISNKLSEENVDVFYIPGQNQKTVIKVVVIVDESVAVVRDVQYNSHSIFRILYERDVPMSINSGIELSRDTFENGIRKKLTIMPGYLKVVYEGLNSDEINTIRIPYDDYSF